MPSLKDLRNSITSVKSTQKITKAMQMVAAAKLRKAQSAVEAARPYAERMEKVLARLARNVGDSENAPKLLKGTGSDKVHLLVVATAERGLCGGFNTSIARAARAKAIELERDGKEVKFLFIGKKGYGILRRLYGDKTIEVVEIDAKIVDFSVADPIGQKIIQLFNDGEFDVATLFYSRFESVMTQVPTELQLIPLEVPEPEGDEKDEQVFYEYEPSEEEILDTLLPRNISVQIFRAMLENGASEQGARMSAMDSATRNAGEMIKKKSLEYNRTRQALITKELIEIISGAEAL